MKIPIARYCADYYGCFWLCKLLHHKHLCVDFGSIVNVIINTQKVCSLNVLWCPTVLKMSFKQLSFSTLTTSSGQHWVLWRRQLASITKSGNPITPWWKRKLFLEDLTPAAAALLCVEWCRQRITCLISGLPWFPFWASSLWCSYDIWGSWCISCSPSRCRTHSRMCDLCPSWLSIMSPQGEYSHWICYLLGPGKILK